MVVTLHEELVPSSFKASATDCCKNVPELPVSNSAKVLTLCLFASTMIGTTLRATAGRVFDSHNDASDSAAVVSGRGSAFFLDDSLPMVASFQIRPQPWMIGW